MTWKELVFEICHKIPDEQFDDEAKIVVDDCVSVVRKIQKSQDDYYRGSLGRIDFNKVGKDQPPIIKQGEFTIE